MTENLGPLRQAMSDLSEHGGSTDMYERALHKSRQVQRRVVRTVTGSAAAVVLVIGGTVAFAVTTRPGPSTPGAVRTPALGAAATPTGLYPGCPSVQDLEKLVELPKGWSFAALPVQCAGDWAAATVQRPTPGGNLYLFRYAGDTGWRYHDQGSGWKCADLGITKPASFCAS